MKVALIGCGRWGANIAKTLAELGALASVTDQDHQVAESMALRLGTQALSLNEVLQSPEVPAVAIATPAVTHATVAAMALHARKHCFVEKPLALQIKDAERLSRTADECGRVLMIGHLLQHHPAFERLLDAINEGAIGTIHTAYSNRLAAGRVRSEEDALWSLAPHDFSMLLAIFGGEPLGVECHGQALVTPGVRDWARATLTFPQERVAHVHVSWLHPFKEHRLVVVGEKGALTFEDSAPSDKLVLQSFRIDRDIPNLLLGERQALAFDPEPPLRREMRRFIEAAKSRIPPRTDAREAIRVLRTLVAASQ